MKLRKLTSILLGMLVTLSLCAGTALAADKAELQKRAEARYPQLSAAKAEGKIGETSDGQVEAVKGASLDPALQKLVDEENRDRRELYEILAKETNTDPALVARRAAARNFEKARPGEWIKRDGKWEQKT